MAGPKLIYVGIKGAVVALNSATGLEVWARKLKGSEFVNVALRGHDVLAATSGEVFCLDAQTGDLRWHNPLKGYGLGLVAMAGNGMSVEQLAVLAEKVRRNAEAAAASAVATSSGS